MRRTTAILMLFGMLALLALVAPLAAQAPTPSRDLPLCADLSGQTNPIVRYEIPFGTVASGGVYCRFLVQNGSFLVNAAQIGNPEALSLGVNQAVDAFAILGNGSNVTVFNNDIKICLQGGGSLFFLDATQSPRPLVQLTATNDGDYTCGTIKTAGTVLLTSAALPQPAAPELAITPGGPTPAPAVAPPVAGGAVLTGCRVTIKRTVRLREEPNTTSAIITRLPFNTTWTATERIPGWFRVIYQNRQAWVSADFVNPSGACGQ